MRALITGISGFVGSRLAKKLFDLGWEIGGIVRRQSCSKAYVRLKGILSKVKLYYGDLLDAVSIYRALNDYEPDVIFHLAAQSHVGQSFTMPCYTMEANVLGTMNLLEAVRMSSVDPRIVFAGSSEEYGIQVISERHYSRVKPLNPVPERIPELPINENNPLRPQSPYAISKVASDLMCQNYYRAYGIKTIISRAFNHEGAGRGDNFVTSTIVRKCVNYHKNIIGTIILGNLNAMRDWSHVDDIIDGYVLLAERGKPGEVYVMGSERTNTVFTYLLWTLESLGYRIIGLRNGNHKFINPSDIVEVELANMTFKGTRIDEYVLSGGCFPPGKYTISTDKGEITVISSEEKYRPSDVPILLSDASKIKKLGFKIRHSLFDIIKEQIVYYTGCPK